MLSPLAQDIDYKGFPALHLRAPDGAEAIVLRYGAQLVSWKPAGGQEYLYMSEDAVFQNGSPIRGGVPVCFPQFSNFGPLEQHGFVRTCLWETASARAGEDFAMVALKLSDSDETRARWPHPFQIELTVGISNTRIDIELEVENTGTAPFSFSAALHTYVRVKEVEHASLEGLRSQHYRNLLNKDESEAIVDTGTHLAIDRETSRLYYGTENPLLLRDDHRSLGINAENMPDTVVWNPWEDTAALIPDLPDCGFRRFLCVEAAVIKDPVTLAPAESWWGRQTLFAL